MKWTLCFRSSRAPSSFEYRCSVLFTTTGLVFLYPYPSFTVTMPMYSRVDHSSRLTARLRLLRVADVLVIVLLLTALINVHVKRWVHLHSCVDIEVPK